MTVAELIEELQKHAPDTIVTYYDFGCGCCGGCDSSVKQVIPYNNGVILSEEDPYFNSNGDVR